MDEPSRFRCVRSHPCAGFCAHAECSCGGRNDDERRDEPSERTDDADRTEIAKTWKSTREKRGESSRGGDGGRHDRTTFAAHGERRVAATDCVKEKHRF